MRTNRTSPQLFLLLALLGLSTSSGSLADNKIKLEGFYRGLAMNTSPKSNLPERITLNILLETSAEGTFALNGAVRLYFGNFDSNDYVQFPFSNASYNLLTKAGTIRIGDSGDRLTLKFRAMPNEDIIKGRIFSDSQGEIARVVLSQFSE